MLSSLVKEFSIFKFGYKGIALLCDKVKADGIIHN